MEKNQDDLGLKTEPKNEPDAPFGFKLKAKYYALRHGVPYSQAVQELLDDELTEKREERERDHAP